MFKNTIDEKPIFTDEEGYAMVDFGESIFKNNEIFNGVGYMIYKIPEEMEMRPDLAAYSIYYDDEYTELLMKYNNIQNPFTIEKDEILVFPSSTQIESHVGNVIKEKTEGDRLIREFHKYVGKNNIPDTIGSQRNDVKIKESKLTSNTATRFTEANMAKIGTESITEFDGKLYFGTNTGMKCAKSGISTTDYMKEIIKNSTDNK